ncbi:unnamed protein product [Phytophthora fragariaefolia]|uniref:Unnamed protein product n=1 Tax=Phytophthora fragariaefolia TaxID=1490495 RepID=A0A9W6Y7M0_9STRA|nr:unnamed protein product [Phytophthora fragariaefolia]
MSTSADPAAPEDAARQARDWWGARELAVERELAAGLQRRMEAQRAQLHAFKTEQSKWEHELQLRISKYAHDRKLLSEHNVELQEQLTAMEEKLALHEREMDQQVQRVIELEGTLHENQIDAQQMRELRGENEELQQVRAALTELRVARANCCNERRGCGSGSGSTARRSWSLRVSRRRSRKSC